MKTEQELIQRMRKIVTSLNDLSNYPINSWQRRMIIKEYNVLHEVLYE